MQPTSDALNRLRSNVFSKTRKLYSVSRSKSTVDTKKLKPGEVSARQRLIVKVIEHWTWSAWMATLTVYALFGDDIRLAATSRSADTAFFSISCMCLGFFVAELALASYAKDGYWLGFYFYLDLMACVSMITDIGWIWDAIVGENSGKGGNLAKSSQIARAARASRAGTRAGRIIRVVRVARLIRLVKLYKIAQERRRIEGDENLSGDPLYLERSVVAFRGTILPIAAGVILPSAIGPRTGVESLAEADESAALEKEGKIDKVDERISDMNTCPMIGTCSRRTSLTGDLRRSSVARIAPEKKATKELKQEIAVPEESQVGQKLSDRTTKRIIILVLGMMFFLPMFSNTMYVSENSSYEYGLLKVDSAVEREDFDEEWSKFIDAHSSLFNPLAYVEILSVRKWQSVDPNDLRSEERRLYVVAGETGSRYYSWAVQDLRPSTRIQAALNIARTVFICVVLTVTGMLFSKDANELVIGPIESMTGTIKRMIDNPLAGAQEAEYDEFIIDKVKKNAKKKKNEDLMETDLLERTIVKIGALLALGFGEAGAAIIAQNMKRGRGDIDPIVEGKMTYCIFGFCDIREFQEVAEVLQESVMHFVNEIALIVHSTVYKYSGAANKNIGDAFLLVWKIPDECENYLKFPDRFTCNYELTVIADMAVIAFTKILASINSDESVMKYRMHEELRRYIPNFAVKMGFGLHVGWAIEGAIGSEFKIDASYLSPNVNLASRFEAATRQFGVPLLLSGQVHNILSLQMQAMCRQVDCVLVKGSKTPMRLYTLDVAVTGIPIIDSIKIDQADSSVKQQLKVERERIFAMAMRREEETWMHFGSDVQLAAMRRHVNHQFLDKFTEGLTAYLSGDWPAACQIFHAALILKGEDDGPTHTLLSFMAEYGEVCPESWTGCRELTEK